MNFYTKLHEFTQPESSSFKLFFFQVTFKDEEDVLKVVADISEVAVMFDSPLQLSVALKQGRGGDANSWQRLAESRAECLKELLVQAGGDNGQVGLKPLVFFSL